MKQLVILLSVLFSLGAMQAQERHVGSEPTQRGILLEEFTGIHCGYCPQGHKIAAAMLGFHQEDISVIAIHAGHFAEPGGGEPDFRTPESTAINDYFGITGYPSGIVDRHDYGWGLVSGRGAWTPSARLGRGTADVNLWAEAVYDGAERTLTLDVEGLYVDNLPEGPVYLNVAITQSRIRGPQNGSLEGMNYVHNHMLRMLATPVEGEAVAIDPADPFFSRRYVVDIPEKIGDTEVTPLTLSAVVFVSRGRTEVVNSKTVHPTFKNFVNKGNIEIADNLIPYDGRTYAGNGMSLLVTNFTPKPIESMELELTVDGVKTTVEGDLSQPVATGTAGNVVVRFPVFLGDKAAAIEVAPTKVNGSKVESNILKINVLPAYHIATEGEFVVRCDNDFADNVWTFTPMETLETIAPEITEYTGEEESLAYTLGDGEYGELIVVDEWGDGVMNPRGMVKLSDSEGNMQVQQIEIEGHGLRIYVVGDAAKNPSDAIESAVADETSAQPEYYSIDGRRLADDRSLISPQIVVERRGSAVRKIAIR